MEPRTEPCGTGAQSAVMSPRKKSRRLLPPMLHKLSGDVTLSRPIGWAACGHTPHQHAKDCLPAAPSLLFPAQHPPRISEEELRLLISGRTLTCTSMLDQSKARWRAGLCSSNCAAAGSKNGGGHKMAAVGGTRGVCWWDLAHRMQGNY